MSEDVLYQGNIIEIEKEIEKIEDKIWNILSENLKQEYLENFNNGYGYDDLTEFFYDNDELYDNYILTNNNLYKINSMKKEEGMQVFYSTEKEDGTIDFVVLFYNGGCSFGEAIEQALNNKGK